MSVEPCTMAFTRSRFLFGHLHETRTYTIATSLLGDNE